jgi:hypothetical protein
MRLRPLVCCAGVLAVSAALGCSGNTASSSSGKRPTTTGNSGEDAKKLQGMGEMVPPGMELGGKTSSPLQNYPANYPGVGQSTVPGGPVGPPPGSTGAAAESSSKGQSGK